MVQILYFFIVKLINDLFPSLGGTVRPCHIDAAHPLKTVKNRTTKVVVVKFVNRWIKDSIINCQYDLQGTGLTVTEHLTQNTFDLISASKAVVGD